jgi:hypothetical protein
MASQLLDRDDEPQQSIQLPISSSPSRKRDSTLGQFINGITSAISSHNTHTEPVHESDAIEIEIPTPSSFHNPDNSLDRELMPINKRGSKLIDISESEDYRDLS